MFIGEDMRPVMPPFNEVGVYCFAHVGRYTRPCPDDNLTQNRARITKFGANIHLGIKMIPIDFQINPVKVKVTG